MIQNSTKPRKHDRLFAFMRAFPLDAMPSDTAAKANLLIVARDGGATPTHVYYRPRVGGPAPQGASLALVRVDFGGALNPLVGALPPKIIFDLSQDAPLRALADLTLAEDQYSRCGSSFVGQRLSEVIIVHALRGAIAQGAVHAGLLAGLAHPDLHPCLVAMHDAPARAWRIGDLADLSGMSRSRFIRTFGETVGQSPIAYLNGWRLSLAHVLLADGGRVKTIAARVGFSSAAAFSRAFSREFGCAPSETTVRYAAQLRDEGREDAMVILASVEGRGPIRYTIPVGQRLPLHATATGKAALSAIGAERAAVALEKSDLAPRTSSTVTDRDLLLAQLSQIVTDGYSLNWQENNPGVASVAAPVIGRDGLLAVISLGFATSQVARGDCAVLGERLRDAAAGLAQILDVAEEQP